MKGRIVPTGLAVFLWFTAAFTFQLPGQQPPASVATGIDQLLRQELDPDPSEAPSAAIVDDETFLRRIFLDLLGEPPTPDDLLAFLLDKDPQKRAKAVETLLGDRAYAENWARYWRDVIMYRRTEPQAARIAAGALEAYLADRFQKNMSWDDIARSFVTAEGDVREHGAAALFVAHGGKPEETAAELSRIFMGIQIQCAQCHDHPTDRWTREQFHQLAAFFPRVAARPSRSENYVTYVVVAQDRFFLRRRQNNDNRRVGTAEHHMPNLDHPEQPGEMMQPVFFVTNEELSLGATDADRRNRLADWMTSPANPWFAKAYVNRIWSELVGEGFYEPVDDMGPDRECHAPQTLTYLAKQFVENEYDPKWLFRAITMTEAYQRVSRPRRNYHELPFQANCNQRLRGDQLFSSLVAALELPERRIPIARGPNLGYGPQGGIRNLFNAQFGFDPSQRRDTVGGSIAQVLLLMNHPLINQAVSARPGTVLGRLLAEIPDDRDMLAELYLRTLAREPSSGEVERCLTLIRSVENRGEAFEDILWALVNSAEFIHRR